MSPVEVDYVGEGTSDEAIARKLICSVSGRPGLSYVRPRQGFGKASLDRRIAGLNAGAAFGKPVLVLRDLDSDAPCAAALVAALLPKRNRNLLLRICVRSAEAWLLADHRAYADFCGVPAREMPSEPEGLADPKDLILKWALQQSARRLRTFVDERRRRAVPDWRILGAWNADFVSQRWDPARAASSGRAPSLAKALSRLQIVCDHAGKGL